jgi:hypothetical protein
MNQVPELWRRKPITGDAETYRRVLGWSEAFWTEAPAID